MRRSLVKEKKLWVFLLVGLFILLSSCKENLEPDKNTDAKTFQDMINLFSEIVPQLDPTDIRKNDWLFTFQKGMIMGNRIDAEIASDISVYEVSPTQCYGFDALNFKYKLTEQKKIDGKIEDFISDKESCMLSDLTYLLQVYAGYVWAPEGATNTFYNVSLDVRKQLAPPGVVEQGCPGMSSCEIRVYALEFKQKIIYPDGEELQLFKQLQVSPDVPFLARDIGYCISYSALIGDTYVPIKQCLDVRNFGRKD